MKIFNISIKPLRLPITLFMFLLATILCIFLTNINTINMNSENFSKLLKDCHDSPYKYENKCGIKYRTYYRIYSIKKQQIFQTFVKNLISSYFALDFLTKRCIIEVKSGSKPRGALKQFFGQKQYAESRGKKHIVFAPKMPTMAKNEHRKSGIVIAGNLRNLIQLIKEFEK